MWPAKRSRQLFLLVVAILVGAGCSGASQGGTRAAGPAASTSATADGSSRTLAELFQGKSGVTVTQVPGGVKLRIRNAQNLDGSGGDPLFVIDGLPISPPDGVLSINPNDVLKIEILKDDASTLIWGQRAANGVVKITTKRK
jgi:TonB-dependent SusC/RagA subfamily outer membrane receptor